MSSSLVSRETFPFSAGRIAFGIALLLFGGEHLLRGRLTPGLPPLPPYLPGSHFFAVVMGAWLLISGTLLLADAQRRIIAVITGCVLIAAACVHLMHSHDVFFEGSPRTVFLEALALGASALALAGTPRTGASKVDEGTPLLAARVLFALTMIVFGIQHFEYLEFVATLVPIWIPSHRAWALFTGGVFLAGGLALLTRIASRVAAYGLALMFFSWLVVLHIPRVWARPGNGDEWASAFVVLALGGGALALAAVVPDRLWR